MTRELLEQALDALDAALSDDQPYLDKGKKSIDAIRTHLAQPQGEPVAWKCMTDREQFEAWASDFRPATRFVVTPDGQYDIVFTHLMWEAWRSAALAERERCAKVCEDRARRNEDAAGDAFAEGDPESVSNLRSTAWQLATCADAIRQEPAP